MISQTRRWQKELDIPVIIVSLCAELEAKAKAAGAVAFVETGDDAGIQTAVANALILVKDW